MPIVPDQKDWTWVLGRRCPECGFDATSLLRDQVAPLVRANAGEWLPFLAEPPELLRRRRHEDRWTPLEYACHVRDVFALYQERLGLMLSTDNPTYPNWDQDRTAVDERYNEQDPAAVALALLRAADALASSFESVTGDAWDRRGSRSDGAEFSVESFARYMIHDPIHHLHDVSADLSSREL
jgi:hypothetical protein